MKLIGLSSLVFLMFCQSSDSNTNTIEIEIPIAHNRLDSGANTITSRYLCPDSFYRFEMDTSSFGYYLSHLTLRPIGSLVHLYNGSTKPNHAYSSVVDMEISPINLQQCADAVMRLRGEYLFYSKQYDKISFRFLADGTMHSYMNYAGIDHSYSRFRKYMDHVFSYANTASLYKQLHPVQFSDLQIGDVLITVGNPYGHAVIVVDLCRNIKGEKMYLLAQSYMPAQETQILKNPAVNSSWYGKPYGSTIKTPEWTFDTADLRRW